LPKPWDWTNRSRSIKRVIILDQGRVVQDADVDELRGAAHQVAGRATAVDGVSSAELTIADGATFERLLSGTVSLAAGDRAGGLETFDEAMRGIVTTLHAELEDAEARSLRVGGITGILDGGEELTPLDLDPDVVAATPRLDRVTAESFYGRYGLG